VGGGASTRADELLAEGDGHPTVLGLSPAALAAEVGPAFALVGQARDAPRPPAGMLQRFLHGHFRRCGGAAPPVQ
jgi:hypothetical protein